MAEPVRQPETRPPGEGAASQDEDHPCNCWCNGREHVVIV